MDIHGLLSYEFLGTFLLLTSILPTSTYSDSSREVPLQSIPRHALALSATPQNIIQQYLQPHISVRAQLGLKPFRWSEKLPKFANSWGNQRRTYCTLIHSNSNYGENFFWGSGRNWTPSDAVAAWASEKRYYDLKNNRCANNQDCLHYTQMVWKQSFSVGCAKVICNSGDTFITCNYDPHGNVIGQRPF